jgi:hypothetical protein
MKGSFEKRKDTITSAKKRNVILRFYYTTCKQLKGNEKQFQRGRNMLWHKLEGWYGLLGFNMVMVSIHGYIDCVNEELVGMY